MKKYSPEVEEYLEILYRYKEKGIHAKTTEVAKELKISPASVSEMFRKLENMEFVKLNPYRGVELTTKGEILGRSLLHKHRLLESFLSILGIKKKNIHNEACILEHALSDEVASALKKSVSKGKFPVTLSSLTTGQSARIVSLSCGRSACRRLQELGLLPGTEIKIIRSGRFLPIELSVRGTSIALGRGLAEKIFVEVLYEKTKSRSSRKS